MRKILLLVLGCVLGSMGVVLAHEGFRNDPLTPTQLQMQEAKLQQVRFMYARGPQEIFTTKCFDCHSSQTKYPWYYAVPGIKQLIDSDIRQATKHINMTEGFPFAGPHTPEEQLKLLAEVLEENEMPPIEYRLMHWGRSLTAADKTVIGEWIERSQQLLQQEEK